VQLSDPKRGSSRRARTYVDRVIVEFKIAADTLSTAAREIDIL
jgi:hypothetical protein